MISGRTAVFIDGANLYNTVRTLDFEIDYRRLRNWLMEQFGSVVRIYYYTAVNEEQEYSSIRPLIDWLDYNGYTVVTKATKEFTNNGVRKVKGNMDIELAVDMLELAPKLDNVVLFSGDGDFRSLLEVVQRQGVRACVVSSIAVKPPMIADELRRQADIFIDLDTIHRLICRSEAQASVA